MMKKYFLPIVLPLFLAASGCSTTATTNSPDGSSSSYESNAPSDVSKVLTGRTLALLGWGAGIYGLLSLVSDDK